VRRFIRRIEWTIIDSFRKKAVAKTGFEFWEQVIDTEWVEKIPCLPYCIGYFLEVILNECWEVEERKDSNNRIYWFRDAGQLQALFRELSGMLVRKNASGDRRMLIWSTGCSTGQEAYSLAMLIKAAFRQAGLDDSRWEIRIISTDYNVVALEAARKGMYPRHQVDDSFRKVNGQSAPAAGQDGGGPAVLPALSIEYLTQLVLKEYRSSQCVLPYCIGIGGYSGVGKSTLAGRLQTALTAVGMRVLVIGFDDFMKDKEQRAALGTQLDPRHFRTDEARFFLKQAKLGVPEIARIKYVRFPEPGLVQEITDMRGVDAIIFEGMYAISEDPRVGATGELVDLPIYLEADLTDVKAWCFSQEQTRARPRSEQEMNLYWDQGLLPNIKEYIAPSASNARVALFVDHDRVMRLSSLRASGKNDRLTGEEKSVVRQMIFMAESYVLQQGLADFEQEDLRRQAHLYDLGDLPAEATIREAIRLMYKAQRSVRGQVFVMTEVATLFLLDWGDYHNRVLQAFLATALGKEVNDALTMVLLGNTRRSANIEHTVAVKFNYRFLWIALSVFGARWLNHLHIRRMIEAFARNRQDAVTVLDLGCGIISPLVCGAAGRENLRYLGVDIDPALAGFNRKVARLLRRQNNEFTVGLAGKLPLRDRSVDMVVLGSAEADMHEVARVLKPAGVALLTCHDLRMVHFIYLAMLNEAGFEIIEQGFSTPQNHTFILARPGATDQGDALVIKKAPGYRPVGVDDILAHRRKEQNKSTLILLAVSSVGVVGPILLLNIFNLAAVFILQFFSMSLGIALAGLPVPAAGNVRGAGPLILVLGRPASRKGTISRLLADKLRLPYFPRAASFARPGRTNRAFSRPKH